MRCKLTLMNCRLTLRHCKSASMYCKLTLRYCTLTLWNCTLTLWHCKSTSRQCRLTMKRCKRHFSLRQHAASRCNCHINKHLRIVRKTETVGKHVFDECNGSKNVLDSAFFERCAQHKSTPRRLSGGERQGRRPWRWLTRGGPAPILRQSEPPLPAARSG